MGTGLVLHINSSRTIGPTMKLLLRILLLLAGAPLFAQQERTIGIVSGGIPRTFAIHLPSAAPPAALPLLLCYHGSGGTSSGMKSLTGFNALADQYGFCVIYPQGTRIKEDIQWNCYVDGAPGDDGLGVADAPDDVQFTRDMIDYMARTFATDTTRVYATGFSNGAYMCYALSMLASDAIKGIAPVAGDMWTDDAFLDQLLASGAATPMPVMHVHGTADNVVHYPALTQWGVYPLFVSARGCGAQTSSQTIPLMTSVDKLLFCPSPVEVCLIRIQGMGHAWSNGTYQTSRQIVTFFGLDRSASVAGAASRVRSLIVAPNPASNLLRIDVPERGRVELISPLGALLYAADHSAGAIQIPCAGMPCGIYLVRVLSDHGDVMTEKVVVER